MPNTKSAKKRLKQSLVRRSRNRAAKSEIKTLTRKVHEGLTGDKLDVAATEFRALSRKLDRAAAKHVVHANAAARVKSRLSAAIKAAKTKAS